MSSANTTVIIRDIADAFMFYAAVFNLILGICGNISNILIFTTLRVFKGNQSAFYLTVESISDIILLSVLNISRIANFTSGFDYITVSLPWCKLRNTIAQVTGTISLYSVCSLSFDQYLSTNLDHRYRKKSTLKLAHRLSFCYIFFSILHSILFIIFTEYSFELGCTVYNPTVKKYLSMFYYPLISSGFPLVCSITTSLLAYHNVRRIVRRQTNIVRRRLDRQMTALALTRVLIFILCGMPFIGISLYELNLDATQIDDMTAAIVYLLSAVFYTVLYTNFVVNEKMTQILFELLVFFVF